MSFVLPKLPYAIDALNPYISRETMEFHYGKHHQAYVNKLNELVQGKPESKMTLENIILSSSGAMFNNAAQIWNHTFYWNCLSPAGGGEPKGNIADAINRNFGSFSLFKQKFTDASTTLFGSGWSWLVKNPDGKLEIIQTKDAGNPLTDGKKPLLTCDVWEHAYYLDYQNKRKDYCEAVFDHLINWDFAEEQFGEYSPIGDKTI